jgi:hypothetical protein
LNNTKIDTPIHKLTSWGNVPGRKSYKIQIMFGYFFYSEVDVIGKYGSEY